jgi:hypothetical protein
MLKIFRNIRRQLFVEKKFNKYLLYAIGEIVLVVLGILIALRINNWNTNKVKKQEEKISYINIRQQVVDDKNDLQKEKNFNNYFYLAYQYANKIIIAKDRSKTDSLALITMGLSQYSDFNRNSNIYETLVNSGDLKLLKNSEITSSIQQLETTYIYVNKLENMHWEIIINELSPLLRGVINYATFKAVKPEKLYEVELQNFFVESIYLTKAKDSIYSQALREIDTIINLIDTEVNSNK